MVSSYVKKRGILFLKLCAATLIVGTALAFTNKSGSEKLIFEEVKFVRSSFCLYDDGKFYQSRSSGCVGQTLAWGYWKNVQDTVILNFSKQDIFHYDIIKSADSQNKYQIIQIVDCYNQPVRFQLINHDTGYANLYNTGILKIKKGNSINYPAPVFDDKDLEMVYVTSNTDTLTYKWHCNRQCLESINGGEQFINDQIKTEKIILRNKQVHYPDQF